VTALSQLIHEAAADELESVRQELEICAHSVEDCVAILQDRAQELRECEQLDCDWSQLAYNEEKTMNQRIKEDHKLDAEGCPAGGTTTSIGIDIHWQDGPLGRGDDRKEPNGAFVEGVIAASIGRLQFYQKHFPCRENAIALTHLETALLWLDKRTQDREERGVEGTHEK